MKAQDVMTMNVVTISPDHSAKHAAQIMLDNRISGNPVVANDGRVSWFLLMTCHARRQ